MPTDIHLPALAESMTSATLTIWLKQPGDRVTAGEPIAEIETDKTTVELPAPGDGILDDIRVSAGTDAVAVGTVLAVLREEEAPGRDAPPAGPAAAPLVEMDEVSPAAAPGRAEPRPSGAVTVPSGGRPATPLARQMAALAGIDLEALTGSGPAGQVTKADIDRHRQGAVSPAAPPPAPPPPRSSPAPSPPLETAYTDEPLTAMRQVTADRMTTAKQTVPHFYLEVSCAVDRLLSMRHLKNAASGAPDITVNDLVVRAAALALKMVPKANSAWIGDAVRLFDTVNVAVAVTTPAGLVAPVVRAADTKDLRMIATELRDLAARARAGRLQPADYQGGTCTISNLGMFGISSLYAIVNPPQSCIFGIGAVTSHAVVRDDAVTVGAMMRVTLSADHRALDGATGAELLRAFKTLIEEPQPVFG